MTTRAGTPAWGRMTAILFSVCVLAVPASSFGQPRNKNNDKNEKANATAPAPADAKAAAAPGTTKAPPKPKTYDFNAMDLSGRMRSPQLLYFLERANEELERASLEKRSFIPHMVKSLEEESL
jgi:hypothetical protein